MRTRSALPSLRTSPDRLWDSLEQAAQIGATADGGVRRLALSEADGLMRDQFVAWCEEAGCAVTVDRIGNVFARRRGRDEALPPVLVGSHLDSQISAGRYDGTLGVLAGLEIVRTLADHEVELARGLEVVSWTNEEGARFSPPMMGSGAFAGALDLGDALAARDGDGITVREALAAIGYRGQAPVGGREIDSYWELHIQQSPELERDGVAVGIPFAGYPTRNLQIAVRGETAHAGPTPMPMRRNALVGAAQAILAVDRVARSRPPQAKSTSTRIEAWPNAPGIVPSEVTVAVDLRHPAEQVLVEMLAELEHELAEAAAATNLEIVVAEAYRFGGLEFDPGCVGLLEEVAAEQGVSHTRVWSEAGHDAYRLAARCPTAMVMCPCRNGISHNPAEAVELEAVAPALDVLLQAVLRRAGAVA